MYGKQKRTKNYPDSVKKQIRKEYADGASTHFLERKYGINCYSIASWCGLRKCVNERKLHPKRKGHPTNKPEDLEKKIKCLEMENELLQNYLQELERKRKQA